MRRAWKHSLLIFLVWLAPFVSVASAGTIIIASTTSTANSGLFETLLPAFEAATGISAQVVAVGTGKAIRIAQAGDADVLFVHHPAGERDFVAQGHGLQRFEVMYNDFVLLGPPHDPAQVSGVASIQHAFAAIAAQQSIFVSRGDDSGTHRKELSLWDLLGTDVRAASGSWYRETGAGMGATLNVASELNAYTISDRATWLKFANKGELGIRFEGDPALFNQYGVVAVSPERHPHINTADAQTFVQWLTGAGQAIIDAYRLQGQQAFFANAKDSDRL